MHKLTINLYCTLLSTQEIYSGKHYRKRVEYKRQIAFYTKQAIDNWWENKAMLNYPIDISFKFTVAKQKMFDTGNYSYTAKVIEDAFKGRVLKDDDSRYVHDWRILKSSRNIYAPFNICDVTLKESK